MVEYELSSLKVPVLFGRCFFVEKTCDRCYCCRCCCCCCCCYCCCYPCCRVHSDNAEIRPVFESIKRSLFNQAIRHINFFIVQIIRELIENGHIDRIMCFLFVCFWFFFFVLCVLHFFFFFCFDQNRAEQKGRALIHMRI